MPSDPGRVRGIEHVDVDGEEDVIGARRDLADACERPLGPATAYHARRHLGEPDVVNEALRSRKIEAARADLYAPPRVDARQLQRAPRAARVAVAALRRRLVHQIEMCIEVDDRHRAGDRVVEAADGGKEDGVVAADDGGNVSGAGLLRRLRARGG